MSVYPMVSVMVEKLAQFGWLWKDWYGTKYMYGCWNEPMYGFNLHNTDSFIQMCIILPSTLSVIKCYINQQSDVLYSVLPRSWCYQVDCGPQLVKLS